MSTLLIGENVLQRMIADAECTEEECCGFIFGHVCESHHTITKSLTVSNSAKGNKHTNFEISSLDYLNAEREAEQGNIALLGVFHTHPNHPAVPSDCDLTAAQPNFSYIIISVMNRKFAEIRSWKLNGSAQLKEEKIDLIYIQ